MDDHDKFLCNFIIVLTSSDLNNFCPNKTPSLALSYITINIQQLTRTFFFIFFFYVIKEILYNVIRTGHEEKGRKDFKMAAPHYASIVIQRRKKFEKNWRNFYIRRYIIR